MNGIMNKNQLTVVKEDEFDKPLFQKLDSIIDDCYRHCHNKLFHTFEYNCVYDIQLTNIINNEVFNITISDKSMKLYELNKKITVARQNGFIINQINKVTLNI